MIAIDFTTFRESVESYLDENFTSMKIQFENTYRKDKKPFIYVVDQNYTSESMGCGEDISNVKGALIIQIYSVKGTGTVLAKKAATELTSLMSDYQDESDNLNFSNPVLASFGPVDGAEYYQHNLTIPYQYFYGQG